MKHVLMTLRRSPLTALSLLTCVWLYVDALYHRRVIVTGVPISMVRSIFIDPSVHPLIAALILTLVALVGACAAMIALERGEEPWYVCLSIPVLIAMTWWFAFSQLEWATDFTS